MVESGTTVESYMVVDCCIEWWWRLAWSWRLTWWGLLSGVMVESDIEVMDSGVTVESDMVVFRCMEWWWWRMWWWTLERRWRAAWWSIVVWEWWWSLMWWSDGGEGSGGEEWLGGGLLCGYDFGEWCGGVDWNTVEEWCSGELFFVVIVESGVGVKSTVVVACCMVLVVVDNWIFISGMTWRWCCGCDENGQSCA